MRRPWAALVAAIAAGCADERVTGLREAVASAEWFSAQIASQLDAQGRLPASRPVRPTDSEVTAETAKSLADSLISGFGASLEGHWTGEAGRRVSARNLRQCGRIDFLEHPYTEIPASASDAFRAHYGSKWAVRYCTKDDIVDVQVFVSATGLAVSVAPDGSLRQNVPLIAFTTGGVPQQPDRPEAASREVFSRSRRPIVALPRHVLFGGGYYPGNQSFIVTQGASDGSVSEVRAFARGRARAWQVRTATTAESGADTLADGTQRIVLTRRAAALLRSEIEEVIRAGH